MDKSETLIGTVGRMCYQKNSFFILDIIFELKKRRLPFKFLWVGKGEEENNLKVRAERLEIQNKIIWYGTSNDIPGILSAIDIFVLPSRYEGLSIVLIEAQANGLHVLVSDTLSPEANLSDKYHVLPLGNTNSWCDEIERLIKSDLSDRTYPICELEENSFTLESNVKKIESLYLSCL